MCLVLIEPEEGIGNPGIGVTVVVSLREMLENQAQVLPLQEPYPLSCRAASPALLFFLSGLIPEPVLTDGSLAGQC